MKKIKKRRIKGIVRGCLVLTLLFHSSLVSAKETEKQAQVPYIEGQVIIAVETQQYANESLQKAGSKLQLEESELKNALEECGLNKIEWIQNYEIIDSEIEEQGTEFLENASGNLEILDFYIGYYEKDREIWDVIDEIEQLNKGIKAEPNYLCYSYEEVKEYSFTEEEMEQQWYLDAIRAVDAWKTIEDNGKIPGEGSVVAVIDTGTSLAHTDLINNIWINAVEVNGEEGTDDDLNGYIDDIYGVNMVNTFTNMTDSCGHGTLMSGIIGLEARNGKGVGVAYGAKVMPIKVSKDGNFGTDMAVKGIEYAVENGADVISMSFGTYYDSYLLQTAIRSASQQCMLVAAAGNESLPTKSENVSGSEARDIYPAAYTNVIGVMGMDMQENLGDYSNWDSQPGAGGEYEIAAPGTKIYSSYLRGGYDTTTGTSPATAVTAGALAVFRSLFPDNVQYPAPALQQVFLETQKHTVQYSPTSELTFTYPVLDMVDMVEYAMTQNLICDKQSPYIEDLQKGQYKAGDYVKFEAEATDNVSIKSVKMYYRQAEETQWKSVEMNVSKQAEGDSVYEAEVNTVASKPGNMEYYYEVYDGTFYTLLGNETEPLTVWLYKNEMSALKVQPMEEMSVTGQALTPDVEIWDGQYRLILGEDYTLSYEDNIQVGTAIVYIIGKGLYIGETSTYFFILDKKEDGDVVEPEDGSQSMEESEENRQSENRENNDLTQNDNSDSPSGNENVIDSDESKRKSAIKSFKKSKVTLKRSYTKNKKKAKLSWKLSGQKAEKWYVYRSTKKNKGYKLWKVTKKKYLWVKCTKKKMYYKVVGVKRFEGKKYKSKKSEAKICIRT